MPRHPAAEPMADACGYGFYLLKGKPVFLWNLLDLKRFRWEGPEALSPGKHTLEQRALFQKSDVLTGKLTNAVIPLPGAFVKNGSTA